MQRARKAAEARTDSKCHQGLSSRVEAERQRTERNFAQGNKSPAPGRAKHPPERKRKHGKNAETEEIEIARPGGFPSEQRRTRGSGNSINPVGQPFLVAQHKKHEGRESQRDKGQVVVLHAQRRIAEKPTDGKAQQARRKKCNEERHAQWSQQRNRIGAYSDESALRQRNLPGVAERQVQTDSRNREHHPG